MLDLRVSPDGLYAASVVAVAANPGGAELRVRNAQTGAFLWSANLGPLPEAGLPRVAFTPNSQRLYFVQTSVGGVESVIAANPATGASISTFTDGDSDFFRSRVVVSADGANYAYQSGDNRTGATRRRIVIRSVAANALVQSIIIGGSGATENIRDFQFSPSGTELVIALASGNVYRKLQAAPETEVNLGFAGSGVNRIERIPGSATDLLFAQSSGVQRRALADGAVVRTFTNIPAGGVTGVSFHGSNGAEPFTLGAVGAFNFPTFVRLDNGNLIDQIDVRRTGEAATDSRMNAIAWTGSTDRGIILGSNGATSPATRVLRVFPNYTLAVPATFVGGSAIDAVITLPGNAPTGGLVVALTPTGGVTVPITVTVPAGSNTLSVPVVNANTDVDVAGSITANFPFGPVTANFNRERVKVSSLVLARESVGNTQSTTGVVTLNIAPTANRTVNLTLNPPTAGTIPATVTVLAGSNTANFTFTPNLTDTDVPATIEATLNSSTASDNITVLGTLLRGVEIYPRNARAGQRILGVVRLAQNAPVDTTANILSSSAGILASQNLVVPAGSSYALFTGTLGTAVTDKTTVTLTSSRTSAGGDVETRTNTFFVAAPANIVGSGLGTSSQLGDGVVLNQAYTVRNLTAAQVVQVSGTDTTTHMLLSTGRIWTHGVPVYGELGLGLTGVGGQRTTPVPINSLSNVGFVATGNFHVIAVLANGSVSTWGRNSSGQLGDNTTVDKASPVSLGSLNAISAAAGETHSLVLTATGDIYVFGTGAEGQLGLGATTQALTPTLLPVPGPFVAVAAGRHHSLALHANGTLYAFGRNDEGQLGLGSTVDKNVPTAVPGLPNVAGIAGGGFHSLVFNQRGDLFAMGLATSGQLGLGVMPATRTSPVQVITAGPSDGVVQAEAGDRHSVILRLPQGTFTTGEGTFGQQAQGTFTNRTSFGAPTGHIPAGLVGAGTSTTFSVRRTVQARRSGLLMANTTARNFISYDVATNTTTNITGTYPANLVPFGGGYIGSTLYVHYWDPTTRIIWSSTVNSANVLGTAIQRTLALLTNETPVGLGDFNNDGREDVVVVDSGTNEVKVYIWNGVAATSSAVLYTLAAGESVGGPAAFGDFDGNNRPDVLIQNNLRRVKVRLFNGTTFLNEVQFTQPNGAPIGSFRAELTLVGGSEYYAAGTLELLFTNSLTGRFQLYDLSRLSLRTANVSGNLVPTGRTILNFWR